MNDSPTTYKIIQNDNTFLTDLESRTQSVQGKLNELGLANVITANLDQTGYLGFTGTLPPEKQETWNRFRNWYDENQNPIMRSDVQYAPDFSQFPSIASLRLDNDAMVILSSGREVKLGDVIFNGYVLKEIDLTQLVLEREDGDVIVPLNMEIK